jgi:hypothetical protein
MKNSYKTYVDKTEKRPLEDLENNDKMDLYIIVRYFNHEERVHNRPASRRPATNSTVACVFEVTTREPDVTIVRISEASVPTQDLKYSCRDVFRSFPQSFLTNVGTGT